MKANFKGLLTAVKQIKVYENSKLLKLEVTEPGKTNEFGEPLTQAQPHVITVMGRGFHMIPEEVIKAATDNDVNIEPIAKVDVTVYVNSRNFTMDGKDYNKCELYLADIKFLN